MVRQFGPSKWMTVQWTAYVTSIWTIQNYGCGLLFWTIKKMVVDRPKLRLGTVTLDHKNVNNKKLKITKIAVKVVVNTTVGQLGAV